MTPDQWRNAFDRDPRESYVGGPRPAKYDQTPEFDDELRTNFRVVEVDGVQYGLPNLNEHCDRLLREIERLRANKPDEATALLREARSVLAVTPDRPPRLLANIDRFLARITGATQ